MSSFEVAWDSIAKNDFRLFPTDICNDCGIDVSKETGISVNRIPADTIQGLYPGGFEQFTEDRQGYGILSRYNPETLRWIFENPSEVDTGWRCALCEVDAYADMEAPDHPEVEDGLWNTALAMDLSSKNTLHYQEFMERFDYLKEHHPEVFNMIEQRVNLLGEGGSDFQASAIPFDAGWDSITKAPFHGTSSDKLEQIMQEGLKPTGGQYFHEPRKRLFFSKEPSGAIYFARQKAEKNKSDPILIHFPDEEDLQHPKPKGELVHNHPFTTKTIPPERLSIFEGPKFPPGNPYTGNPKAVADYHLWDRRLDNWGREMDKMREWLEGNL